MPAEGHACLLQVGNFRVEPPGLFRGRGDHPRMGKLKARIYPRDITINIGAPSAAAARCTHHMLPKNELVM